MEEDMKFVEKDMKPIRVKISQVSSFLARFQGKTGVVTRHVQDSEGVRAEVDMDDGTLLAVPFSCLQYINT